MSPILVVEITYDFGLRIETGTERPLLYIIYKCTVHYSTSTQLIEVVMPLGIRKLYPAQIELTYPCFPLL